MLSPPPKPKRSLAPHQHHARVLHKHLHHPGVAVHGAQHALELWILHEVAGAGVHGQLHHGFRPKQAAGRGAVLGGQRVGQRGLHLLVVWVQAQAWWREKEGRVDGWVVFESRKDSSSGGKGDVLRASW